MEWVRLFIFPEMKVSMQALKVNRLRRVLKLSPHQPVFSGECPDGAAG
jgi:hypothetical protein